MTRARRLGMLASVVLVATAALSATRAADAGPARVTASISLAPDSISGVSGPTSIVAVRAALSASGKSLGSYALTIVWDSTVVRLDSVRAGDFGAPLVNYASGGEVRLTQVNTSGRSGTFSLAQLHYRFVNDTAG